MSTLVCILFMTISVCYATNCYELQQSQITSLNDRMAQMLNSFYTPVMPNPPPMPVPMPVAMPGVPDYGPYDLNPYQYNSPNSPYGSPSFYTPPGFPKPTMKPYYPQPKEYPAFNWGNYYENYPQYTDFDRPQFSPPTSYTPPPYAQTPYVPPCSRSPPLPSYPAWEYPFTPEYQYSYPTYTPPPPQFTQYLPPPPASYPSPLYHRYAEIPPNPYFY